MIATEAMAAHTRHTPHTHQSPYTPHRTGDSRMARPPSRPAYSLLGWGILAARSPPCLVHSAARIHLYLCHSAVRIRQGCMFPASGLARSIAMYVAWKVRPIQRCRADTHCRSARLPNVPGSASFAQTLRGRRTCYLDWDVVAVQRYYLPSHLPLRHSTRSCRHRIPFSAALTVANTRRSSCWPIPASRLCTTLPHLYKTR
jgi:hypothetical protein